MSNISANPWSFVPGDVNTTTITSMTLNGDTSVTAVVAATAGFAQGNALTAAFNTSLAGIYNRFYIVTTIVNGTTMTLQPIQPIAPGTGAAGATGNIAFCQWPEETRVEDISWQSTAAPFPSPSVIGASDALLITDKAGNLIWSAVAPVAAGTSFSQNRGKIFWVNGVTIFAMTHGVVLMTVN